MTRANMIYVVYPYAQDRYNAVLVHERAGNATIHNAIAAFENDETRSGRRWKAKIEAGSFKIAKISNAENANDAIVKARMQGLSYEPKPDVLKRYRAEQSALRRHFDNLHTQTDDAGLEVIKRFFDQDKSGHFSFTHLHRGKGYKP